MTCLHPKPGFSDGSLRLMHENAGGHGNDTPILPYLNAFPATQHQS
jgi:hypothetical protein